MKTLTLKLPEELDALLSTAAAQRGDSKSSLVREAIAAYINNPKVTATEISCYDLARDLAGSFDGPRDLSTNKKHMKGFGR